MFKEESSVSLACKLDGTCLNGLNLRVAPRKEKPPEVAGETLLNLDMKKFRHEKHPRLLRDIDEFLQGFQCVGSFSQDKKESNTIIVPGCPPVLDWNKVIQFKSNTSLQILVARWTRRRARSRCPGRRRMPPNSTRQTPSSNLYPSAPRISSSLK